MLQYSFSDFYQIEAGCDEAGRGCLSGPVFAAAVILPKDLIIPGLDDSKKISEKRRYELREIIKHEAISWSGWEGGGGERHVLWDESPHRPDQ